MWIDKTDELLVPRQDEVELSYWRGQGRLERLCRCWLSWVPWSGCAFHALWGPTWTKLEVEIEPNGRAVFDPLVSPDWDQSSIDSQRAYWLRLRLPVEE